MIERWEHLSQTLAANGHWTGAECDEAIRLGGESAHPNTLANAPTGWLIRLYNLIITPGGSRLLINQMFEAIRFPAEYRGVLSAECLPEAGASLTSLQGMVEATVAPLRELEADYRTRYEDPDRDEAETRALILRDPSEARLFLRYHAEARTAFHRAYRELVKTLEADAASPVDDAPNPVETPPPAPQNAVSPNEANRDASSIENTPYKRLERLRDELPTPDGSNPADVRPQWLAGSVSPEPLAVV